MALIGSREFAHQIKQFTEETQDYTVVGYFDDFRIVGEMVDGLPILGKIDDIESLYSSGVFDNLFIAAGYNNFQFRSSIFDKFKGVIPFANIIMPTSSIENDVILGEGIYIGPRTCIGHNCIIEDNVFVHGDSSIGHDSCISAHTYLSGRDFIAGFVHIGKRNFMGLAVTVSDHISTIDDVWIGIGCIVCKDLINAGKYMSSAAKLYQID